MPNISAARVLLPPASWRAARRAASVSDCTRLFKSVPALAEVGRWVSSSDGMAETALFSLLKAMRLQERIAVVINEYGEVGI